MAGGRKDLRFLFYNLTTTLFDGGIEVFNRELAIELARRGYEVEVWGGRTSRKLDLPGVKVRTFPYISRNKFKFLGSRFRKLMERLTFFLFAGSKIDRNFDWIILSKPYDVIFIEPLKKGRYRILLNLGGWEYFKGLKRFLKKVEIISACSQFLAKNWENLLCRPVKVIYNGVDLKKFYPALEEKRNIFISVCRLHKFKNLQLAIKAVKKLDFEFKYFILGDGPEKENLIRASKGDPRIKLVGQVPHEEIPSWLRKAKLALYPSIGDTFCIAAVEAMACGIPVVAANRGGLPEVVGKEGGIVVEPEEEAFRKAIIELIKTEDKWEKHSLTARLRAETLFSWQKSAEKLLTLIKEI